MIHWKEPLKFQVSPKEVVCGWAGTEVEEEAQRIEALEAAAYERGREAGERSVNELLLKQRGELLQLQQGIFAALERAMPEVVRDCEKALAALALETARKLVSGLPISPVMIEAALKEALSQVDEQTDHHVYLHPEDLDLLKQINSPALMPDVAGRRVQFHGTPDVTRCGCLVRTRFGVVDGRRETKLQLLEKTMWS